MKLEVLHGRDGILAIEDAWRAITQKVSTSALTQMPEYYLAYANAFDPPDNDLLIFTVKNSAGQIIAIVPLESNVKTIAGISIRSLAFPDVPVPIRDIVIEPSYQTEETLEFLIESLSNEPNCVWDYLHLRKVPEDSSLLTRDQSIRPARRLIEHADISHTIDVSKSGYLASALNSNARNNLRRNKKKLKSQGKVEFRTITTLPDLETAYEHFLETEAAGWKSVRGGKRAVKLHADHTRFYRDLMRQLCDEGRCHIHLLFLDDRPVASDYCVISGGKSFSIKHGFDETYSRFAPGNLLRAYTIEFYERNASIGCIDLLSGWDWQRRWRPEKRDLFDIKIFRPSLRGNMLYHLARLKTTKKNKSGQN